MFKSAFIHIGPHKTGSSYIQSFLIDNKKELLEKGFVFPNLSDETGHGHHNLAKPMFIKNDFSSFINKLSNDPKNDDKTLILSAENFSRLKQNEISLIKDALKDIKEIQALMFIRNPASILRSLWCESIKHKSCKSHPDFLIKHFVKPHFSEILNPYILHNRFLEAFPVKVINYDRICKKNLFSIAKTFLEVISCDDKLKYPTFEINKSFSLEESEIYRNLNIIFKKNNLPTLIQKDFKDFVKKNDLQKNIDEAKNLITKTPFENSALSRPYKRFIEDKDVDHYNPKDKKLINENIRLAPLEVMLSYNESIMLKQNDK